MNLFSLRNFTGFSFGAKVGKYSVEFTAGIVEEITFNITTSAVANTQEILDSLNLNLISKDQIITTTAVGVSSKIVQSNIFGVMAGATPNLFI